MILEQLQNITSLLLILILVRFTIKYRNLLVASILIISTINIVVGETADTNIFFAILSRINAGILTYLIYDYIKLKQQSIHIVAQNQAEAIVKATDYSIVGIDIDGKIINWQPSAAKLYGWDRDEVIGKSLEILIPKDRLKEHQELIQRLRNGEDVFNYHTMRKHKTGCKMFINLTATPVYNANNKVIGISIISNEFTNETKA